MTPFGISNLLLPPLYPKSNRLDGITFNDFRAQINQFGADRPTPSDLLFDSFVFVSRRVPPVNDLSGPLAAFRVNEAGRFVTERFQSSGFPIVDNLGGPRRTERQRDDIDNLQIRLQTLLDKVEELRNPDAFNLLSARSSNTSVLRVTADRTAKETQFEVMVEARAASTVRASDVQGTGALGLTGDFQINGVTVAVLNTDTLADIRDKINRGEDVNGNGRLDGAEDVNGNGMIDTIQVSGSQHGPGVFIIEDQNGNGVLDPAEDANGNLRLDGGTRNHGVTATLFENRLLLSGLPGADSTVVLNDPDSVLFNLGFFELDTNGALIPKDVQLSAAGVNLVTQGNDAGLSIENKTFSQATNVFSNVVEGVTLDVLGSSGDSARVTVETDVRNAVAQIQSLFLRINDAISVLNDMLVFARTFPQDFELQSVREELTENSQTGIRDNESRDAARASVDPSNSVPSSLGLNAVNTEKFALSEPGITGAVQAIRDGVGAVFFNRGSELFKKLSSIGIKTESDDTIRVDVSTLARSLESQPANVLELFNDSESGILPRLQAQLEPLLTENVGRLDFKSARLQALSELNTGTAESFQRAFETELLKTRTRNLIAIA